MEYSTESKDRLATQMRKGILELAVMGVLYYQRHYGYSLARALSDSGAGEMKEGTIYPILARLNRDGLVDSEWVESEQGPPRKYYGLTLAGRQLFDQLSRDLDVLVSLVKRPDVPRDLEQGRKLLIRKA